MNENEIGTRILDAAMRVHRGLAPGLLESAYQACLSYELAMIGVAVRKEVPLPLVYREVEMELGFRLDLLVEDRVVVEIKAEDAIHLVHMAQVMTYLRLNDCKLGYLLNFNVALMKDRIRRVVNNF